MLCGINWTEVLYTIFVINKGVVEFILPLCLLIVSAFRYIWSNGTSEILCMLDKEFMHHMS